MNLYNMSCSIILSSVKIAYYLQLKKIMSFYIFLGGGGVTHALLVGALV